jgi:peptidoglycan/xylan/chitin deacetylase (PgdA/CDA1 family)
MHLVQWSDTGYDWKNDAGAIARAALRHLQPGSVVLLHDGFSMNKPNGRVNRSNTVKALSAILEGGRKAGFTFVSVRDFLPET